MQITITGEVFGVEVNNKITIRSGNMLHHFDVSKSALKILFYEDIMPLFLGKKEISVTGILKPEMTEYKVGVWDAYFYYDFVSSDWK